MSRREAWLTAVGIFALAVVIRIVAAALIPFPRPEDTAYYVGVARNLVEGRGLVSDALWSYGTPPLEFPRPAFEVWLPLPSLLEAIPIWLSGARAPIPLDTAMRAAQVVSVLVGALLPVLTWRLAADVAVERDLSRERARTLAIGAGLTAAVYLPLVLHSALPDSTVLFGALALGACLLMTRVARDPRGARWTDPRLLAIGALLGLAALTRNEALWLALVWVVVAWRVPASFAVHARLVGTVAVVALVFFVPWAIRDWAVFGNPVPGQAAANALSASPFDIFAWNHPPTLASYLALGPQELLGLRVTGLAHNLFNVLLFLGVPISVVGLVALPWQGRDLALRPLLLLSVIVFLVASLVFPVATTWGTFLHASAPVHVLLIVASLAALDAGLAWVGRRRGWTKPVAWLGAVLAIGASALFTVVFVPSFGASATATERTYAALARAMAAAGVPLHDSSPIIHDTPIWLAETDRVRTLALPDESPADVLDLANDPRFGAKWLILATDDHGRWPAVLDSGDPNAACFQELHLPTPPDPNDAKALEGVRVFRITCTAPQSAARPADTANSPRTGAPLPTLRPSP